MEKNKLRNKIKLVIWDADNTLWNGTVYYRDKESIKIKPGTAAALKELDKRGIASTLCSKNNYEDVLMMLKKFGIDKYFREPQVDWGLKSEAVKRLAELFNLSFDAILFVDDDPFQRAEVKSQIPSLKTIGLQDPLDILNVMGIKQENETEVDKHRICILKEARNRKEAEKTHNGNYKNFLKQCKIKMVVREVKEKDWPRVVQLLNRTNELNATGNRYKLEELKNSYKENKDKVLVAELTDKFGDYGLIAETIIRTKAPNEWFIRDLTVSCRTIGRGIGSTLVLSILDLAKKSGIKNVEGYVKPTESNWRMQPLFENKGFKKIFDNGRIKRYKFDLNNEIMAYPGWLDVTLKPKELL